MDRKKMASTVSTEFCEKFSLYSGKMRQWTRQEVFHGAEILHDADQTH